MGSRENVEVLKRAYDRWYMTKASDIACWTEIAAEDIVFSSLADEQPAIEFAQARKGRDQVRAYLKTLTDGWELISGTASEFIADGDRVVALGHVTWRNKATGKVVQSPKADIWRMRDGSAVEVREFYDTARVLAAIC